MSYPIFYVPSGDVLPIMFATYDGGTGASITLTGLAVTDIEIYKDGGVTQRASDAGYTLLDTDGIDFDGVTGIHGFSIDTGDNTDAGFYAVGAWYHVVVSSVTVDAQTVNFIAAAFRIMAAEGVAAVPDVNVTHWNDTAVTTPPSVNATQISGDSTAADNAEAFFDGTGYAGTGNVIPSVTTVTGNVNGSVGSVATGGIAAASFAAGAIDAAAIAADAIGASEIANGAIDAATFAAGAIDAAAIAANAIGASELAADAVAEIADGVWDEAASGHSTQGTYGEQHFIIVSGAAIAGTLSTTAMTTDLTEATDDHYNGRTLIWTTGVLVGQATNITDYTGATKLLTYTAVTEAPTAGDKFLIY